MTVWHWLVTKFEKRINNWTYRILSLGGRVILIRSILTSLAVYWFALDRIPKSILNYLRHCIFSFLWGSSDDKQKLHLVDWNTLVAPYEFGGSNIKHMDWFGISLRLKSLWSILNGNGIWSQIITFKYFKNQTIKDWLYS